MTAGTAGTRVLLVDDDEARAAGLAAALQEAGYRVSQTADALNGLIAIEEQRPAVVVLHWHLPFIDGSTFLSALRTGMDEPPPVIALVASTAEARQAQQTGTWAVLPRDTSPHSVVRLVRRAHPPVDMGPATL